MNVTHCPADSKQNFRPVPSENGHPRLNGAARPREPGWAWRDRFRELVALAFALFFNRRDASGRYRNKTEQLETYTDRNGKTRKLGPITTCKGVLMPNMVGAHYTVNGSPSHRRYIRGVLFIDPRTNTVKNAAVEIDCHLPKNVHPQTWIDRVYGNERAAIHWYKKLVAMGFRPLLLRTNDRGSYHLWIFFDRQVAAEVVFNFMRCLVADHQEAGLDKPPETFPKQPRVAPNAFGNWLRLPGRHHSHAYWARVYCPAEEPGGEDRWLDEMEAVGRLLAQQQDDPTPITSREWQSPPRTRSRPQRPRPSPKPFTLHDPPRNGSIRKKRKVPSEHSSKVLSSSSTAPPSLLCSLSSPTTPLSLTEVVGLYGDRDVSLAVARHLGLEVAELESGETHTGNITSPLPWRDDENPSARLLMDGTELVIHDHGEEGCQTYNLAQLAYARATNKPTEKGTVGPVMLLWRVRLLVEAGVLSLPAMPELPACPGDAPGNYRKVYDGFKLLWRCKQLVKEWRGKPTEFSQGFIVSWCGVSSPTASRARQWLAQRGVISIVGTHKGTCVYRPGYHRGPQGIPRRSQAELDRIRRNELNCVRRVAALVGYTGPELTWETKLSDRLLDLAARVRRSWKVTSVERSIVGSWVWDRPKS
jgi:hypothetical protein